MKTSIDRILIIYTILEFLLFCWLLTAQALGDYRLTDCLIYICILLDALFAACTWLQHRTSILLVIAMLLTLTADTLLVLLDEYYITGVLLFCCVQVVYGIYIHHISCIKNSGDQLIEGRLKDRKPYAFAGSGWVWMRLGFFAFFVCALTASGQMGFLQILTVFSFSQLLANCLFASYAAVKCPGPERFSARLFAAGLLLFLGCDLCVGIRNLPLSEDVRTLAFSLNWIFYVPSQYLIVRGNVQRGQTPL